METTHTPRKASKLIADAYRHCETCEEVIHGDSGLTPAQCRACKRLDESIRRERDLEGERDRLKAVNAELLAALTVSHDAMIIASGRSNTAARAVSAAIHQARAAIAKARGQ